MHLQKNGKDTSSGDSHLDTEARGTSGDLNGGSGASRLVAPRAWKESRGAQAGQGARVERGAQEQGTQASQAEQESRGARAWRGAQAGQESREVGGLGGVESAGVGRSVTGRLGGVALSDGSVTGRLGGVLLGDGADGGRDGVGLGGDGSVRAVLDGRRALGDGVDLSGVDGLGGVLLGRVTSGLGGVLLGHRADSGRNSNGLSDGVRAVTTSGAVLDVVGALGVSVDGSGVDSLGGVRDGSTSGRDTVGASLGGVNGSSLGTSGDRVGLGVNRSSLGTCRDRVGLGVNRSSLSTGRSGLGSSVDRGSAGSSVNGSRLSAGRGRLSSSVDGSSASGSVDGGGLSTGRSGLGGGVDGGGSGSSALLGGGLVVAVLLSGGRSGGLGGGTGSSIGGDIGSDISGLGTNLSAQRDVLGAGSGSTSSSAIGGSSIGSSGISGGSISGSSAGLGASSLGAGVGCGGGGGGKLACAGLVDSLTTELVAITRAGVGNHADIALRENIRSTENGLVGLDSDIARILEVTLARLVEVAGNVLEGRGQAKGHGHVSSGLHVGKKCTKTVMNEWTAVNSKSY
ncbi:hypothetical protein HG531_012611 [Fusarium graminearum]|nr:hypothetical protein HG531_012611 [Fusarium graminearum]